MKKYLYLIFSLLAVLVLSGCEMEIIEDKNAKYTLDPVDKGALVSDKYYVKDGTKFYQIYEPDMSNKSVGLSEDKCAWFIKDESLIPNYYSNEYLAQSSRQVKMDDEMTLERYEDDGYSFAVHGAYFSDGYIKFNYSSNVIEETSAAELFQDDTINELMIETIDGQPVTADMINEAGIITGLEKDREYNITYYMGTYYKNGIIKADTHFLRCFEVFTVSDKTITKNGYISLKVQPDLKSGYYRLGNNGFFRYLDYVKGDMDISATDFNAPYYNTKEELITANSQQFTFKLEGTTSNLSVVATYNSAYAEDAGLSGQDNVLMMITSPEGKILTTEATVEDGTLSCDMSTSLAGKWTVNIMPQNLQITGVNITPNAEEQEATRENFEFTIDEAQTGVTVSLEYQGEGNVKAQVIEEDGTSHDLSLEKDDNKYSDTHKMVYTYAYIPAGRYKVSVYHYPDTVIKGIDHYLNEDVKQIDIITIEE